MNILEKTFKLENFIISSLANAIQNIELFYSMLVITAFMIVLFVTISQIKYHSMKRHLKVHKGKIGFISKVVEKAKKSQILIRTLSSLATRIGIFNKYSYEKNLEFAVVGIFALIVITICAVLVFLPTVPVPWYISLGYITMAGLFIVLIFCIFSFMARQKFTGKMPDTYKLLNSRYIITGNILKAINISMEDFDKTVKKEMLKIYNVLKKNNIYEIENTFKMIEITYKNQYLTLLLNLIKQAYFKGGNNAIKKQFEQSTEEILYDIENQKDLSLTAKTYIFIAIFLPFGLKWLEKFNFAALGDKSIEFYTSTLGIEIKIIFYFAFLLYLGVLLFIERTA